MIERFKNQKKNWAIENNKNYNFFSDQMIVVKFYVSLETRPLRFKSA